MVCPVDAAQKALGMTYLNGIKLVINKYDLIGTVAAK